MKFDMIKKPNESSKVKEGFIYEACICRLMHIYGKLSLKANAWFERRKVDLNTYSLIL